MPATAPVQYFDPMPVSTTYDFSRDTPPTLLEPDLPYGEDLLQFIWEKRFFDQHALRTMDGAPIEVLDPGTIQRNSGPDLDDAQIRIGGQLWAGPVEVHLRASEWYAHGHQFDPAYENVILHVVYEHDREVRTPKGRSIPTIELFPRISTDSIALYRSMMTSGGAIPCASGIGSLDAERIDEWLDHVSIGRLERKAIQVIGLHEQLGSDPANTFYHLLLQSFGMRTNAGPFGMLAHALPLRILMKYRDDPVRTEALLLGQAGLLRTDLIDEHPRRLQEEHGLLAHLHDLRPIPGVAWKFGKIRPVNLPTIRLAQLAKLFTTHEAPISALLSAEDPASIHTILDLHADGYWSEHYRIDQPSAARPKHFGRAAAEHVMMNAVIPCLYAFSKIQGRPALKQRALRLLEALPPEKNNVLAEWASAGIEARSARRGQALLELRKMHCQQRQCLTCGIGSGILQNTSPSRKQG